MKLLTNNNIVFFYGSTIEKGIYSADPSRELYKITNESGIFYSVTEGLELYEVDDNAIPNDFATMKYCYTVTDGFYMNQEYLNREPSAEEKIAELESQNEELYIAIDTLLTEIIPSMLG